MSQWKDVASKNVTFDKMNCEMRWKGMHIFKFKKLLKFLVMSALNLMEVAWNEIIQEHNSEICMYPLLLEKLMEKDNKLAGFVASRLDAWNEFDWNTVKVQNTRCWSRKSQ